MLLAVSWKDMGRSVAVKLPKKESISAASVLFLVPVLPIRNNTNFGSQFASFRKWFRGERNTRASNGKRMISVTGPAVSSRVRMARSSPEASSAMP